MLTSLPVSVNRHSHYAADATEGDVLLTELFDRIYIPLEPALSLELVLARTAETPRSRASATSISCSNCPLETRFAIAHCPLDRAHADAKIRHVSLIASSRAAAPPVVEKVKAGSVAFVFPRSGSLLLGVECRPSLFLCEGDALPGRG
jgi:hypothetical protein